MQILSIAFFVVPSLCMSIDSITVNLILVLLHQFVVKNVFLHRVMEEGVYMEIPLEFDFTSGRNKVNKYEKGFNRLKQFLRAWIRRFTKAKVSMGYKQSRRDYTLLHNKVKLLSYLCILIISLNLSMI